jgi:hypothetical protein
MYIREDMADIRVTIDSKTYGDSWKQVSGGNLTADDAKTRPGGMGREVSAGGPASRDDLTVEIQMSDIVATWIPELETKVGNGSMKVSIAWLGQDRAPTGSTHTRTGTVKELNLPDMGGGADVGMLSVVMSCNEQHA